VENQNLENQNVSSIKMHKIEIGKGGNFSAWNENFRAEISVFSSLFVEQKLSLRTLVTVETLAR